VGQARGLRGARGPALEFGYFTGTGKPR